MITTKAIRVFYRKSDSQIVWTSSLEGTGEFPRSIEDELNLLPETKIFYSEDSFNLLGGTSSDYACIEETQRVSDLLASDTNKIVDGQLIIGEPRVVLPLTPARDLFKEVDELRAEIRELKEK